MVLITLVATAGYLALAVWGAGGIDAFFSEPARIALAMVVFALGIAALFSSGQSSAGADMVRPTTTARPKGLAPLIDWMGLYAAFWHERFDDLEDLLKRMDQ
jgi:hypothetical protein